MINISSDFDGGNIEVIKCESADDIELNIRKDNDSEFYQWFYYRLTGAAEQALTMKISNAKGAAFAEGFKDYRAVASYDRISWFRVDTEWDETNLLIKHTPEIDSIYYAYFAPYSMERHADLIAWAVQSELVSYEYLGATLDGQDMDLLNVSDGGADRASYWVIARQHPGETMAEWWMEGFLGRLLDDDDPVSRELLKLVNLHVVPNMNPDGSRRGHLRTNAVGSNLNREWDKASAEKSPEVLCVLNKMHDIDVDFCLDVHGDEDIPYNFIAGPEGTPSWTDARQEGLDFFKNTLMAINPDFQIEKGYPADKKGEADMSICTNYIAETFDCLSMTLEMPFKDTELTPDETFGWSPERCRKLGETCVDAIYRYALRQTGK